ncbi:zinc finger protein [Teratosphaeria destructans]|uniref:Zinc finger protein n=1 Tax=Teratosphaeria destructans TaxID=418781 RepID=A0A9W7SL61_9PEZI|nr:zinc finger protein [Teratosphaeria destructans]
MAPYNTQYGNYYDPVGSQSNQQPTGYTYQQQSTSSVSYPSATATNYQNTGYSYGNSYGNQPQQQQQQQQQYSQPAQSSNTHRVAAAALSSLGTSNAQTTSSTYGTSSWGHASANYPGYSNNDRAQEDSSPLYTNAQGSTSNYGRLNVPEQPSTAASNTYTSQAYQSTRGIGSSTVQPPQRYASPLHAAQAQQNSRVSHQPSPQLAAQSLQHQHQRQQSGSVEPSATTVNPSQVYDDRAERQRQARIEAEKRRKREEQEAARKAEEDTRKAEEDRKAAEREAEEDRKKAEADAAKKKADFERKAEQRRKAREEKKHSKSAASAASTLQQMASSGSMNGATSPPPVNDEEAEMRAMFKKMREFNAKNPAMLAKLWEEERSSHTASQSPQQQAAAAALPLASTPTPTNSLASRPAQDTNANAASAERSTGYRPFLKPPPHPKAALPATNPKPAPTAAPAPKAAPSPATPTAAHSLWSPHQKGTIADAAIRWLTSLPENSGKRVTRDEVSKMLEGNPSYVGLCEGFERSGFRFDRTLLARELLKRVPDGMKGSAKAAVVSTAAQPSAADLPKKKGRKSKDPTSSSNGGTVNYEMPSFTPLADAAREVNRMGDVIPPMHLGGPVQSPPGSTPFVAPQALLQAQPQALPLPGAPIASGSRAASQSQPPEVKPEVVEEPPKPPANKEEAARKRTFGDLVDLTAQDDSDDEGPPKKVMASSTGLNGSHTAQQSGPPHLSNPMVSRDFYRPGQQPPPTLGQASASAPVEPSANMRPGPSSSVASNVPPPPPKPKGPSQEQLQQERVRGKMLVEPIMRDRVVRKSRYDPRTIARDVLLATGRHPDMRGLNGHLLPMSKLLAERGGSYEGAANKSDLSTIRWDIIDPSTLKVDQSRAKSKKPLAAVSTPSLAVDDTADADDEEDVNDYGGRRIQRQEINHGDGTVSYVNVYAPPSHAKAGLVKRRRGRPPRHSLPAGAADTVGGEPQRPGTPARRVPMNGTPQSAPAPRGAAGQPLGYSAFRALDENGNVIKKKGRPVGWRKAIHSREAAGLSPNKSSAQGRPKKLAPQPSTEPEPRYPVYRCQWRGCQAELHNLEILKKHIVKLHGHPNFETGAYECLWEPCGNGKSNGKSADRPARFQDIESWMKHVNEHLQPIAWRLGDGPRSDAYGTDSEAYLSDAQGRSVTPVIVARQPEGTSQVMPNVVRSGRPPAGGHAGMTKDERKAAESLKKLDDHKKQVGVVMEQTSGIVANRKRRQGFLDDEDFEDEEESDGVPLPDYGDEAE